MIPGWALTLEDYRRWVLRRLDELGALVEPEPLDAFDLPLREQAGGIVESGIYVPQHRITFADGLLFQFEFTLYEQRNIHGELEDFDLDQYSFGLRKADGTWIWRYDKHSEPHWGFSCREHAHVGPSQVPQPSHEVDLDDALRMIEQDRSAGLY